MELSVLKKALEKGEPMANGYAFSCEDRSIADVYVAKMADVHGLSVVRCETMADAIRQASVPGLTDEGRMFVARDDARFLSDEAGWRAFLSLPSGTVVGIWSADAVKPAFAKAMGDSLVEFRRMTAKVLAEQIIAPAIGLGEEDALAMAENCDRLYGLCASEMDKVSRYAAERGLDGPTAYAELMAMGQLRRGSSNDRHHFVNSFVAGDPTTYAASRDVDPLELISLLYTQCRYMYLVDMNAGNPNICEATGMTRNQVNAYRYKRRSIRSEGLIRVMEILQMAESGIKTGKMPKESAAKYVMAVAFAYASAGRRKR